jgi:polar amino acid transport system permease protein
VLSPVATDPALWSRAMRPAPIAPASRAGRFRAEAIVVLVLMLLTGLLALRIDWHYVAGLDYALVWEYRTTLLLGAAVSLGFTGAGMAVGYPLGALLAIAGYAPFRPLRWLVVIYIEFWRNTPLLVQLFWVHFALPVLTRIETTPIESGFIALTANVAAYYAEVMRAGIDAVPRGQWDAARALGLRGPAIWRTVVLPQALRIVLPPSTNLLLSLFKGTSVLTILGIGELMQESVRISTFTFRFVEPYTAAALIYVVIGLAISWVARRFEQPAERAGR